MRHKNKKEQINKILKKKKEYPVIDLYITNYNNSNFYLSLLYNNMIDKFKVLYVPIDAIDTDKIEEYFCYQFINVKSVSYIIDQIKNVLPKYEQKDLRNKKNKKIHNFQIDIKKQIQNNKYN